MGRPIEEQRADEARGPAEGAQGGRHRESANEEEDQRERRPRHPPAAARFRGHPQGRGNGADSARPCRAAPTGTHPATGANLNPSPQAHDMRMRMSIDDDAQVRTVVRIVAATARA